MSHAIIIRFPAIKARTGLSRATIYRLMAEGVFPKSIALGARSVGWPDVEVSAINTARIAGKSDDEIRALVTKLEAARKTATSEGAK